MEPLPTGQQSKTSIKLCDNHGRTIDYLRLAITDRCNLRCRYCMPEHGVRFVPYSEIMRYEEMVQLVRIFAGLGIRKVRITGGEPFARRDCIPFLRQVCAIKGIQALHVTTNGVATASYLDELQELGIAGINLSLDTLDRERYRMLCRYDCLGKVMDTLHGALRRNIPLKINTVVLDETSDEDILAMIRLAEMYPVTVRFIEKMPFSGGSKIHGDRGQRLLLRLHKLLPLLEVENDRPTTARLFSLPGHTGHIGIIEGYTRKFCSTCNKLRVTPISILKTCLYDDGVLNLKAMLRSGSDDATLCRAITGCVGRRFPNGLLAEAQTHIGNEPSMASIGG